MPDGRNSSIRLAARLLPSAWRWFAACVASSQGSGDDRLLLLGDSTLRRLDRALRARDRLLEQFQLPADNDTADEALFQLDVALLMLNGAFDSAAQVTHESYGLGGRQMPSWRRREWRETLLAKAKEFADCLRDETPTRDVLDLVGLLRNTVHGEALRSIAYSPTTPSARENLLMVPERGCERILAAVQRQGGPDAWGLRPLSKDFQTIEADTFIDALIPACAQTLDGLMERTDVCRLPHVDCDGLPTAPPEDDDLFRPALTGTIRLLAGV